MGNITFPVLLLMNCGRTWVRFSRTTIISKDYYNNPNNKGSYNNSKIFFLDGVSYVLDYSQNIWALAQLCHYYLLHPGQITLGLSFPRYRLAITRIPQNHKNQMRKESTLDT